MQFDVMHKNRFQDEQQRAHQTAKSLNLQHALLDVSSKLAHLHLYGVTAEQLYLYREHYNRSAVAANADVCRADEFDIKISKWG